MKESFIYFVILLGVFCVMESDVSAACSSSLPIWSYYHFVDGIGDCSGGVGTDIKTLFYAYNYDDANSEYPNSGTEDFFTCLPYGGLYYWQTISDWANPGIVGCPVYGPSDEVVQILAYDDDLSRADNYVQFAVFGTDYLFEFDWITDGNPDGGGGNSRVPVQSIPQVTITDVSGAGPPYSIDLSWQEPVHYSYGVYTHNEYFWGYRVYYNETLAGTPPLSNEIGWTPVHNGTDYVPRGAGGATIQMNNLPTPGNVFWFALTIVGQGEDGLKTPVATPFETGFVGQSSSNFWTTVYLGDYVWYDLDCNGCQDVGEPGVDGIELWVDNGFPIASDITSNGYYEIQFNCLPLPPDNYDLWIIVPNGYFLTIQESSQCGYTEDSDFFWFNGFYGVGVYAIDLISYFDNDIDAGIVVDDCHLGDYVWQDDDMDGIQDPNEDGLANVEVILSNPYGSPQATDYTDANGLYLFTDISPGEYNLEFILPDNYAFSPQNQGSDDYLDSDPDPATGLITYIQLHPCYDSIHFDAGMFPISSIPPPAADGTTGSALTLTMGSGDTLHVDFDAVTCSSDHAVILYGDLDDFSMYTGEVDTGCNCGNSGSSDFDIFSSNVWFNLVWVSADGTGGHPGFATSGDRTMLATGLCGVTADDHSDNLCD